MRMLNAADADLEGLSCREKSSSSPWPPAVWNSKKPLSSWPPVWKSIQECPQYYYLRDFLEPFREKSTDPNTLLFYKQVEETRGYDVTVGIFNGMNPFSLEDPLLNKYFIQHDELYCQAVVQHINHQAKMYGHGELYEYVEFVKRVPLRCTHLMTFKVKKVKPEIEFKTVQACMLAMSNFLMEVEEWRFKPDQEE